MTYFFEFLNFKKGWKYKKNAKKRGKKKMFFILLFYYFIFTLKSHLWKIKNKQPFKINIHSFLSSFVSSFRVIYI